MDSKGSIPIIKDDNTKYANIRRILKKNSKYHDFGPTLLSQHLEEKYWISINKEPLRQIMIRAENGEYPCLLCAVDDATGKVYAQFSKGESFEEVFRFWKKYFALFGKPEKIYLDCHATYKVHSPDDYWDEKRRTCFERGMRKLGVIVIFSKTPQGKGRVEKENRTHQDRLVKKMRLLDIKTIEEENKYLTESYLEDHNKRFGVVARERGDLHSKLTKQEKKDLEWYFAKEELRTVKNDGTVHYKHRTYQLKKGLILKSRLITIKESIYGNVRLHHGTDCLR